LELMEEIQGSEGAARIRDSFDEMSPDFGRYVVEAGFADVYGRPGLTLAQRQLLNVGVLTAIGGAEPQLAVHLRGALNVGVTPREIAEAIFHVALYAGHPRSVNGLRVMAEVFAEAGIDPRDPGQPSGPVRT
jgi:4-carboxymuconolactone decarboxylase